MTQPVAYRLTPVHPATSGLASAALITCAATGKTLSGSGGGGIFLSPEIVDALRQPGPKAIVDQADLDALIAIARAAARDEVDEDTMQTAGEVLSGLREESVGG